MTGCPGMVGAAARGVRTVVRTGAGLDWAPRKTDLLAMIGEPRLRELVG